MELEDARARLGYLLRVAPWLGWLPVVGPDVAHAPDVLRVGDQVAGATDEVLGATAPLFDGHGTLVDLARGVFVTNGDALGAGLAQLDAARPDVDRLAAMSWRGPFAPAGHMLAQLSGDLDRVPDGIRLTGDLRVAFDALLGFGTPKTYVVVGQNDQELRPTGGFIGTMGLVTVKDGKVASSDYRSSYDFDPKPLPDRPPPDPMIRYLGSSVWLLREANWWPNFPDSGRQVLQFMQADQHLAPDGVIAVDSEMVGLLLGVFGPISVPQFPEPLTQANWFVQADNAIYDARSTLHSAAKEAYLQPVLEDLLGRAQSASHDQVPALLKALQQAVAGRHLQVYVTDPRAQSLVDRFGASGAMQPRADADFVGVVDANFSYDKIQPAIHRDVTYLRHGDGTVDLLITWRNEVSTYDGARYKRFGVGGGIYDYEAGKLRKDAGVFGNFTRIYLLPGSQLVAATGFDSPPGYSYENGLTVVSGFLAVDDGQQRSVRITYRPKSADPLQGVLFWKQGGFTPGTVEVLENTNAGNAGQAQVSLYRGALDHDRYVAFEPPESAR